MLTGIQTISPQRYQKLISEKLTTGGNLLVIALAGSGKTEMPIGILEERGIPYQYINLSVLEAPDLIGVPKVDHATGMMSYATPEWLPYAERTKEPVVLVIDELDKSKPELQNPLLEMMQFHTINGKKLNIRAVFCTANMPDEGAFSLPMNHALTNRCSVYKMETSYPDWQEWAVKSGVNELVVGFLGKFPDKLQVAPNKEDPTAYCRASPRSWTWAARDLDSGSKGADIEDQTITIAGRVGTAAAMEFRVWMEHYRVITPYIEKLVSKGTFPPDMPIDQLLVCAIAACGEVARITKTSKDLKTDQNAILKLSENVFNWLVTLRPEHQIAAVKSTLEYKTFRDFKLNQIPSVIKVFGNLSKILTSSSK